MPATPSGGSPDARQSYSQEVAAYSADADDAEYDRRIALAFHARELRQIDDLIDERQKYAARIYKLVVWWLIVLGLFVLASGVNYITLDVKVMLALIGGTTANVLGIFIVVANFFFPKKSGLVTRNEVAKKELIKSRKKSLPTRSKKKSKASATAKDPSSETK